MGPFSSLDADRRYTGLFNTRGRKQSPAPYIKSEPDLYDDDEYFGHAVHSRALPATTRTTYIKKEPDLDDEYGSSFSRGGNKSKLSTTGGYLAKKSAYINQFKRMHSSPDMLHGHCFETTSFVVGPDVCIEVSHMLIDSGAASSFISKQAAHQAHLDIYLCEPQRFLTASGVIYHKKFATFELIIAGVSQTITAYVDEGSHANDSHVLLGVPAMKQFDMRSNHCFGDKQETRWSISQNIRGLRRKRYVLQADPYGGTPAMQTYPLRQGLRVAMQPGEKAKERDARETLERTNASRRRRQDRYGYDFEERLIDDGYGGGENDYGHGEDDYGHGEYGFDEDCDMYDGW